MVYLRNFTGAGTPTLVLRHGCGCGVQRGGSRYQMSAGALLSLGSVYEVYFSDKFNLKILHIE